VAYNKTQIMKKLLFVILSTLLFSKIIAQTVNISTGLNSTSSSSETIGANDGSWRYGTAINGTTIPKVMGFYTGYWQATPVATTGAQWIGTSGDYLAQKPGLYYFERTIAVSGGVGFLNLSFSVAIDDELKSIELIDPSGTATDLTPQFVRSTTPSAYYLSKIIKSTVKCPAQGKWKLRVYVNFFDTAAGFLLSGTASTEGQCQPSTFEDTKCCKGNKAENLSTGFANATSSLTPNASPDDDWKLTSPTGTAIVTNPAIVSYAPASSKAQWIMPKGTTAGGSYTYERTIVVPLGYEANLTFSRIGADNEVELFVDSPGIGATSYYKSNFSNYAFTPLNVIIKNCLYVKGLKAGTHKIRAVVYNESLSTGLLVEGCFEFIQVACKCPAGWLSNTSNIDGDITLDGKCKKKVCGPLDIKPLPTNGTPIGTDGAWGFTWGDGIFVWGTKANGGAAICPPKVGEAKQ
jgi:hypothetical protein